MNKSIKILVLCLLLGVQVIPGFAMTDAEVKAQFQQSFPMLRIERISPSPLSDLFEILTDKGDLFYFSPKTAHVVVGEILTSKGKNITKERKQEIAAARIASLPLDNAIKIGDGKHRVIEIVDPDCPYCRKGEVFFEARTDVTRHIFLYPVPELHPDAERKSRYILCAEDREKAYKEVLSGKLDQLTNPIFEPCNDQKTLELLAKHKKIAEQLGGRGTPAFWVNGYAVQGGLNIPELRRLLKNPS